MDSSGIMKTAKEFGINHTLGDLTRVVEYLVADCDAVDGRDHLFVHFECNPRVVVAGCTYKVGGRFWIEAKNKYDITKCDECGRTFE